MNIPRLHYKSAPQVHNLDSSLDDLYNLCQINEYGKPRPVFNPKIIKNIENTENAKNTKNTQKYSKSITIQPENLKSSHTTHTTNQNRSIFKKLLKTCSNMYSFLKILIATAVVLTLISCGLKADENSPYLESIIGHFVRRTLRELDKNFFYIFREPVFIAIVVLSVLLGVVYFVVVCFLKKRRMRTDLMGGRKGKRKRKITDENVLDPKKGVSDDIEDSMVTFGGCQNYRVTSYFRFSHFIHN